ncbi:MAG: InlB B-repeat-containing protein [Spirochaetaceae bacterium]|jgi:hypothetical protein|nr:InlB B-repeat-containing protein [Spirochaetaceae bacterium]
MEPKHLSKGLFQKSLGFETDAGKSGPKYAVLPKSKAVVSKLEVLKQLQVIWAGIIFLFLSACSDPIQPKTQYYTLAYLGNGNTQGNPPLSAQVLAGTKITVAVNSGYLIKDGHYFAGWNTRPDGSGTSYKPGKSLLLEFDTELYAQWDSNSEREIKTFYAVTTDNIWYMVDTEKLAENDLCVVYGDVNENISPATAEVIAGEYAANIYPKITGIFGDIMYMPNNNGKLFLFLLDIIDGYTGSGGYVAGYFDSSHMFDNPYSNKASMLFMDVYPGDSSALTDFSTIIAHELQHLIHFSISMEQPQIPQKSLWINEGLSLAAEYIYGGEQAPRLNYFNGKFGDVTVDTTIPYGNNFFVWDGYWEQKYGDYLADYSTAYLFFRWLGIQAGDDTIYKTIVNSEYADYRAVTESAKSSINSEFSDWKTLLAAWMLANYYQQNTGLYGYKNQLPLRGNLPSLTKWMVYNSGASEPYFFPGEGVFSPISLGSRNPSYPAGNIHYIGLPNGVFSISSGSLLGPGPYTGNVLLTFNGNTDERGDGEVGYVAPPSPGTAGMSRSAGSRNNPGPIGSPPGTYPVDFRDRAKKNRSGAP